jgi:myo-inositol-1(or 4)-monophosphatase
MEIFEKRNRAIMAARLGREVLLEQFGKVKKIEKKFKAGLVSEVDRESERVIFNFLKGHFPNDLMIGEESCNNVESFRNKQGGQWIVDPLDGTTNYLHGLPIFAVSIGYRYNGITQIGVIDVPILGEVYSACLGQGSKLNGHSISVSQTEKIEDALLATGFSSEDEEILVEQIRIFNHLVRKARGVRRAGAAAYDLCMVAKGVFDAYWEKGLKPWDSAAGDLIVREAGGLVVGKDFAPYNPYDDFILATTPKLLSPIQKLMS